MPKACRQSSIHFFFVVQVKHLAVNISILNSSKTVLAKSGAEGVLFVTNNDESYLFKCIDGSKRGVDLAATKYLNKIGMVNEKPFRYLSNLYSLNTQNTKAVTITVS